LLTTLRTQPESHVTPILALPLSRYAAWHAEQTAASRAWLGACGFTPGPGAFALLPGPEGQLAAVVLTDALDPWAWAALPQALPVGCYRIEGRLDRQEATRAALGWALGSYTFARYHRPEKTFATLLWPEGCDRGYVENAAAAIYLIRDLVNTPACDLGPAELADAARRLGEEFEAQVSVITGVDLLENNYPAVFAVGRASPRQPRLIDLRWGRKEDPRVSLVGKGVCFDTGGLNLKSGDTMRLMKKDMGGAAHALGLARMIMMAGLPIRLRVLIPAVENAVSGLALRPLDVIQTRKGLTIEVGDTDAEGRLVLCDALAEADREQPELLIDFATLTGAARAALGPDLPALFSNNDLLAAKLAAAADVEGDPLWRLPLWQPYRSGLRSKVADLSNIAEHRHAGAIMAALFLETFVNPTTPWLHFDIMAWNATTRPGRPEGGEAVGLRAVYALLAQRYDLPHQEIHVV